MATIPQKSGSTAPKPAYTSPLSGRNTARSGVPRGNQTFLFGKKNYMWMGIGIACILLGFALLSGGKSPDPHGFNYDEIYSFRRITLAPIVILIGFGIEAYAIMLRRDDEAGENQA